MNKKYVFLLLIVLTSSIILINNSKIIIIDRFNFQPEDITISKGTRVYWINIDLEVHNITSDLSKNSENKVLHVNISKNIGTLEIFYYKFTEKGEFDYYCILHPYMKGRILVN